MEEIAQDHATSAFTFRLMKDNELEETHRMIDLEKGWNLTLSRFKKMKELFDNIYVTVNSEGEVVGTLCIVPTHNGECVLGNFVVAWEYRGKGLGKRMLMKIQQTHAEKIVSLVASPGAAGFYSKCGMRDLGPIREEIFMEINTADVEKNLCQHEEIVVKPYTSDTFDELCQYDRRFRGFDMSKYLSLVVATCHLFVAHSKSDGKMTGYAAGYQKRSTLILDGCYADNDNIALHLFWNILKIHPERKDIKLYTIKPRLLLTTLGKVSLSGWHQCARFTNGNASPTSLEKLYAASDCDFAA